MSSASVPVIGIPVRLSVTDAPGTDPRVVGAARVFDAIVDLVRASGARPQILGPGDPLEACDGFVVPGGGDVDPALYGGPADHPALYDVNQEQDRLDLAVLRHALDARLPLLGICRGLQLLNVVRGGTLHVDLPPGSVVHDPPAETGEEWALHDVQLEPDSRCARAFGTDVLPIASGHHQAVDRVGEGLRVTARAADGCVEGLESATDEGGWVVAVQWHPEAEVPEPALRAPLFEALCRAASPAVPAC
ncbi:MULTISPECIES: gamma-glutamyl-gamma-aminobutyrate hydrolase family protein [unclassified Streptomyces]|uniref:gamma-glutamyl-gamma-aminobutyrate hydrolase family protein n=1 Tax=unclassified Streptomyces TaxID=2593676 RepID=UPI00278C792C|nr:MULTISPECIES: gamma-glutamyl-gamma-aminobutyrate hydrolase family protein [unclassified Streptomyces]